jgi:hypothetical protein
MNVRRTSGIVLTAVASGITAKLLEDGRIAHANFELSLNLTTSKTPICNTVPPNVVTLV